MSTIARTDTSILGRWWWTVDRWTAGALLLIILFGALMIFAASPAVAERIGLDSYHFVRRQLMLLPVAATMLLACSLLSPLQVRRAAVIGFIGCIGLMVLTLLFGPEIKGAKRWLSIGGFSLQASEFLKPCFAVVSAWMFAEWRKETGFPGQWVAMGLYGLVVSLLLMQPDLGQTVVVSLVWFGQFFLAGLPMMLVGGALLLGAGGLVAAYFLLPHVNDRINRFLDPSAGDSYQVERSLEAFRNGGLLGTGPGEGQVKAYLPDAHADFVFSVTGEEFGAIVCLLLIALFGFVVLRGFARLFAEQSLFVLLAGAGLLAQFGLQALIHMASALQLMPAKGMTLPFISYGGSSLLALALGMGLMLALTRSRAGRMEAL
ncbi:putative lipid II flippase FtsW [Nisaea acidiphila]|uniref:Probable peptidoglycan glycosyltransferase FtsW n=1 Tax=Nisaea acidiphila TaxID=1862145 RepID=A0A9J7ARZ0_9PROT|nr:putative peptidoglycan glycosyltransferase FtsW [Nisaea acidiphila]UUX49092.1 putative lipid II flippase FtsW [Nisaea acidiphila]